MFRISSGLARPLAARGPARFTAGTGFRTDFRPVLSATMLPAMFPAAATIFSDSYIGVDTFQRTRNRLRLQIANEQGFKDGIRSSFEASGLQNIFADDIIKLVDVCDSSQDLDLVARIVASSLSDEVRTTIGNLPQLVNMFFLLCKIQGDVEIARSVWTNAEAKKSGLLDSPTVKLRYYVLLYDNGRYQEVVDQVAADLDAATHNDLTVAVACLAKIGTREALSEATKLVHRSRSDTLMKAKKARRSAGSRMTYLYAWLAFSLKEYGTGYDILSDKFRIGRSNLLVTNMKLAILTEVKRFDEALLLIRSDILSRSNGDNRRRKTDDDQTVSEDDDGDDSDQDDQVDNAAKKQRGGQGQQRKPKVCFQVMRRLADAVKEENNAELSRELAALCKTLDDSAVLVDKSLEELVFEGITRRPPPPTRTFESSKRRPYSSRNNNLYSS